MLNCLGVTYTGSCCLHCASGGHTVDSSVSQQKYDVLKNFGNRVWVWSCLVASFVCGTS